MVGKSGTTQTSSIVFHHGFLSAMSKGGKTGNEEGKKKRKGINRGKTRRPFFFFFWVLLTSGDAKLTVNCLIC